MSNVAIPKIMYIIDTIVFEMLEDLEMLAC
jgi:hypothetical protein